MQDWYIVKATGDMGCSECDEAKLKKLNASPALCDAIEAWRQVPVLRRGDILYEIRANNAGRGIPEVLAVLLLAGQVNR
jgi:hypothetical protein